MRLRPFSHIVFDLDGVLLDTEPLYAEAAARVVASFGGAYSPALHERMKGRAPELNAREVIETLRLPVTAAQYLALRAEWLERLLPTAHPMPGAQELVTELLKHDMPLAIATTSSRRTLSLKLEHAPWLSSITVVVAGDDPGVTARKPAPDVYLRAAERLCAEPAMCLAVEDSDDGIRAAQRAGMQVIAVGTSAVQSLGDAPLRIAELRELSVQELLAALVR